MSVRRIVLTGPPGIGKTTLVKSVCSSLQKLGINVVGFYTEELRQNNQRIGFDAVLLDGTRAPLARIEHGISKYKVGRYTVNLTDFESLVLPALQSAVSSPDNVIVIDEIGKMEMLSEKFVKTIEKIFTSVNNISLATIPDTKGRPVPLLEMIKRKNENKIIYVSIYNRDSLSTVLLNLTTDLLRSDKILI